MELKAKKENPVSVQISFTPAGISTGSGFPQLLCSDTVSGGRLPWRLVRHALVSMVQGTPYGAMLEQLAAPAGIRVLLRTPAAERFLCARPAHLGS
jgi:hypothetical protein